MCYCKRARSVAEDGICLRLNAAKKTIFCISMYTLKPFATLIKTSYVLIVLGFNPQYPYHSCFNKDMPSSIDYKCIQDFGIIYRAWKIKSLEVLI